MSSLGGLRRRVNPRAAPWGAGPRLIQAGWVAMRENTAARLDRTARLRDYLLVSREKRLNPRYSPGCQTVTCSISLRCSLYSRLRSVCDVLSSLFAHCNACVFPTL